MSDSSRDYGSGGSLKSLKGRLQTKQSFQADGIKKGFSHLSDMTKNMGATLQNMFAQKSDSSVYSKGVRELDDFGYEKYNIDDDGGEIFISRVPEKAMFNDGEPMLVRATGGNFVGSSDSTSARIEVDDHAVPQEEDISKLFGNVQRGTLAETEFHATVGKVTDEGTIEPTPINNAFLSKMKSVPVNDRAVHRIEFEDEVPEAPVAEDTKMFVQMEDDGSAEVPEVVADELEVFHEAVPETVEESPAEVSGSFLDRMTRASNVEVDRPRVEFFVDTEEDAAIEVPEEVTDESDDDDYSWIEVGESDGMPEDVTAEIPVEASEIDVDIPVEDVAEVFIPEAVEEAPVEASEIDVDVPEEIQVEIPVEAETVPEVIEAVEEVPVEASDIDVDIPVEDVAEASVPEAVESIEEALEADEEVAEEIQVEIPVEAETVPEVIEAVEEAPVEPVAVMALPKIEITEPEGVTGLKVEGSEPSSGSEVNAAVVATEELESAVTGAEAVVPERTAVRCTGLTEDGEALPPLSDPVIRRPRSVRFRFNNGVLQNVDSEKVEPREELRDPLA